MSLVTRRHRWRELRRMRAQLDEVLRGTSDAAVSTVAPDPAVAGEQQRRVQETDAGLRDPPGGRRNGAAFP